MRIDNYWLIEAGRSELYSQSWDVCLQNDVDERPVPL